MTEPGRIGCIVYSLHEDEERLRNKRMRNAEWGMRNGTKEKIRVHPIHYSAFPIPHSAFVCSVISLHHYSIVSFKTLSVCSWRNLRSFSRNSGRELARIATASRAALIAPAVPIAIVPTGTPPGI